MVSFIYALVLSIFGLLLPMEEAVSRSWLDTIPSAVSLAIYYSHIILECI